MRDKGKLMQTLFGKKSQLCRDCNHLVKDDKQHYKCEVYGESETTDWEISQTACGLWNVDTTQRDIYKTVEVNKNTSEEIPGQMELNV